MTEKKLTNVLFALNTNNSNKVEDSLLEWYRKEYNEEFTFSKEYYLQGVVAALKQRNFDVLVINETLELTPINIQYIDALSDDFPNLRIILVLEDSHKKDNLINKLFSLGVYNCIFKNDLSIKNLADLINSPRSKKEAKIYFDIDNSLDNLEEVVRANSTSILVPEDELNIVLENFNKATIDDIKKLFSLAEQTYSFQQVMYIMSLLKNNEKVMDLLKESNCSISKYEKAINRQVNKVAIKEKANIVIKEVEKIVEVPVEKIVKVPVEKQVFIEKPIEKEIIREIYKTPDDYKKVIAIVGASSKVGTTTLTEILAAQFSKDKDVAILDFSINHDLFERYIFKTDYIYQPLQELIQGNINPYKINKKCSLYTNAPNIGVETLEMLKTIDIVKSKNDVILIDTDLLNLSNIYSAIDKVVVIIDQDINNAKYFTNVLSNLSLDGCLPNKENKIQFVINKYIENREVLKDKDLINCYLCRINYLDFNDKEQIMEYKDQIYKVNFNGDILLNCYTGKQPYSALTEEESKNIYNLCNSLYPISSQTGSKNNLGFTNKINSLFQSLKK